MNDIFSAAASTAGISTTKLGHSSMKKHLKIVKKFHKHLQGMKPLCQYNFVNITGHKNEHIIFPKFCHTCMAPFSM